MQTTVFGSLDSKHKFITKIRLPTNKLIYYNIIYKNKNNIGYVLDDIFQKKKKRNEHIYLKNTFITF